MQVNFMQQQPFYSSETEAVGATPDVNNEPVLQDAPPEQDAPPAPDESTAVSASAIGVGPQDPQDPQDQQDPHEQNAAAFFAALEESGDYAEASPIEVPATAPETTPAIFGGNMSQLTRVSLALFITLDLSASADGIDPVLENYTYNYRGDDVVTNLFDPFKKDRKTEVTGLVRQALKGLFATADSLNKNSVMYFGDADTINQQVSLLADAVKGELQKAFIGFDPMTPIVEGKVFSDFVSIDTWTSIDVPEVGLPEQVVYANIKVKSGAIICAETPHAYIDRAISTLRRAAQEVATPIYVSVALRASDVLSDARIEDAAKIISEKMDFDIISRLDVAEGVPWASEKLFPKTADVSLYRGLLDVAAEEKPE